MCLSKWIHGFKNKSIHAPFGFCICKKLMASFKINLWNRTKWGLFFNIVLFDVQRILISLLQCLDPIGQESNQQQICCYHRNFSPHPHIVIYWPSTELSIKRCTCVNKRKNNGSKWAWDNNITRYPRRLK